MISRLKKGILITLVQMHGEGCPGISLKAWEEKDGINRKINRKKSKKQ